MGSFSPGLGLSLVTRLSRYPSVKALFGLLYARTSSDTHGTALVDLFAGRLGWRIRGRLGAVSRAPVMFPAGGGGTSTRRAGGVDGGGVGVGGGGVGAGGGPAGGGAPVAVAAGGGATGPFVVASVPACKLEAAGLEETFLVHLGPMGGKGRRAGFPAAEVRIIILRDLGNAETENES